jgi:chromosome segregation ATPase
MESIHNGHATLQKKHENFVSQQEAVQSLQSVELDQSKQQHQQALTQLRDLQYEHRALKTALETMEKERWNLRDKLDMTSSRWQKTKLQLEQKHEESRTLQGAVRAAQQSVTALKEQRKSLEKEMKMSEAKYAGTLQRKTVEFEALAAQLTDTMTLNQDMKREFCRLRSSLHDMEIDKTGFEMKYTDAMMQLNETKNRVEFVEREKKDLQEKLAATQSAIQDLKSKNAQITKERDDELAAHSVEVQEQRAMAKSAIQQLQHLQADRDKEKAESETFKNMREVLKSKLSAVEEQQKLLREKFVDSEVAHSEELQQCNVLIKDLQEKLDLCEEERNMLLYQVDEMAEEYVKLENRAHHLSSCLVQSEELLAETKEQKNEAVMKLLQEEQAVQRLQEELEREIHNREEMVKRQHETLKTQIESLGTDRTNLGNQLSSDSEEGELKIVAHVKTEIQRLKGQLRTEERELESLRKDEVQLEAFSKATQASHAQIVEKHQHNFEELQRKISFIQLERNSAKNESFTLAEIHHTVQKQLQALEKDYQELQKVHQQSLKDLEILMSEKNVASEASGLLIDSLQKEKDELNEKVHLLQREGRILKEQLAIVDDRLEKTTSKLEQRVEASLAMESEVEKIQDAFVALQQAHETLITELDAASTLHLRATEEHQRELQELRALLKATGERKVQALEKHRSLESQSTLFREQHHDLAIKVVAMSKDLEQSNVFLQVSEDEKARLCLHIEALQREVTIFKKKKAVDAAERVAMLEANYAAMQKYCETAKLAEQKAEGAERELTILQVEHEALQETARTLQRKIDFVMEDLDVAKAVTATAQQQVEQTQQERDNLQATLSGFQEELVLVRAEKDRILEESDAASSRFALSLEEQNGANESLLSTIHEMRAERDCLAIETESSKGEALSLRSHLERIQTVHDALLLAHDGAKLVHDEALRSTEAASRAAITKRSVHKAQSLALKQQVDQLQLRCLESEAAFAQQRSYCDDLRSKLLSKESDLLALNKNHEYSQQDLELIKQQRHTLLADKESKKNAFETLKSRYDEKVNDLAASIAINENLLEKHKSLEFANSQLRERLETATVDLKGSQTIVLQNQNKLNELQELVSSQKDFRNRLEEHKSKVLSELEALSVENNYLNAEKTTLEIQLQDMETKLKDSKEELKHRENEIVLLKDGVHGSDRRSMGIELELAASKTRIVNMQAEGIKARSELSVMARSAQELEDKHDHESTVVARNEAKLKSLNEQLLDTKSIIDGLHARCVKAEKAFEDQAEALASEASIKHIDLESRNKELEMEKQQLVKLNESQQKKIKMLGKLMQTFLAEQAHNEHESTGVPEVISTRDIAVAGLETDGLHRVTSIHVDVDLRYHDQETDTVCTKLVHAKYTGPLVGTIPHGPGVLKFQGGDLYVGMFEHGKMSNSGTNAGSYVRTRKHHRKPPKTVTVMPGAMQGMSFGGFILIAFVTLQLVNGFTPPALSSFTQLKGSNRVGLISSEWCQISRLYTSKAKAEFEAIQGGGRTNLKVRSIMSLLKERYGIVAWKQDTNHPSKWKKTRNYLYNTADKLSPSQVEQVLNFLDERFPVEVSMNVLQVCPRILRKPADSFLVPTADFLVELWGAALFVQAIERNPALLLSRGVGYVKKSSRQGDVGIAASATLEGDSMDVQMLLLNRTSLNENAIQKLKRTAPFVFGSSVAKVASVMDFLENILVDGNAISDAEMDIDKALAKIVSSHPHVLNLSVEQNLRPRVEYLLSCCGMDAADVAKIVLGSSGLILGLSVEQNLRPTMEYIAFGIFRLDISSIESMDMNARESLRKCLLSHPQLLGLSLDNFKRKVEYFQSLGPTLPARIASKCPAVYSLNLVDNIIPTIGFLERVWGPDNEDEFERMLFEYPNVLTLSLEGNLQPTMAFFNKTGYTSLGNDWTLIRAENGMGDENEDSPKQPDGGRIRGRYVAASLYSRLLPRWHYCFSKRTEIHAESVTASKKPLLSKPPPLHLLVMASDQAFCNGMGLDVGDYLAFREEAIPRLKFSSQFDIWLKSGRPIEL